MRHKGIQGFARNLFEHTPGAMLVFHSSNTKPSMHIAFALSPATLAYQQSARSQPNMYIGRTDARGIQNCVVQLAYLAVDEFIAGHCTRIEVTLNKDGSATISDNGRGLPTEVDVQSGLAAATSTLTYPALNQPNQVNGIDRFAVSSINAMARRLELRIVRDGILWGQDFVDGGLPTAALAPLSEQEGHGTSLRFWPDISIFEEDVNQTQPFEMGYLQDRMRRLACFYPGLVCTVRDDRDNGLHTNKEVQYVADSPAAILELVSIPLGPALASAIGMQATIETEHHTLNICIMARPHAGDERAVVAFVNNQYTHGSHYKPWAGSHETGFTFGLLAALNEYGLSNNLLATPLLGCDVLAGTAAYIHVQFPQPVFNHRCSLDNNDVQSAVQTAVYEHCRTVFNQNPRVTYAWLGRAARSAIARLHGIQP